MSALDIKDSGNYTISNKNDKTEYTYCINKKYQLCNWIIPIDSKTPFCKACDLNHTIPNISIQGYLQKWQDIEIAKHRLVYALLRLDLPVFNKPTNSEKGIAFDFVSNNQYDQNIPILTGHDNGLITINIAEADDIEREMARKNMAELYRTLIGHFRHEIGHYYWDRLIKDTNKQSDFRKVFGDETRDYTDSLQKYYQHGTSSNWNQNYISSYAAAHPWEDWAETWAHYMHIMDTLETSFSFGLSIHPHLAKKSKDHNTDLTRDPYTLKNFNDIIAMWLPVRYMMNSLNRSMGLKDAYPIIIPAKVFNKLSFIHDTSQNLSPT